jgi:regulator of sirC expression with transglutaminase-like and TPR domain
MGPMLLPYVLKHREGTCLGLAALYLTLAERLGLPLVGVLAPGHFFVRYQDRHTRRDIELLKEGREMPRSWYQEKYGAPDGHPLYMRSLDRVQTLAVFQYNLANMYGGRREYRKAIEGYRKVVAVLPDFAEAHANMGRAYQLLGERDQAEQAYLRARAAFAALPGIQQNLDSLRR